MIRHAYAVPGRVRPKVYVTVLGVSLTVATAAAVWAWWWVPIAFLAVYLGGFTWWVRLGWRWFSWHGVPDLNGTWQAAVGPAVLVVDQTWVRAAASIDLGGRPLEAQAVWCGEGSLYLTGNGPSGQWWCILIPSATGITVELHDQQQAQVLEMRREATGD